MIRFTCPQCGHNAFVRDEYAGKKCRCGRCQSTSVVPGEPTAAAPMPLLLLLEKRAAMEPKDARIRFECTSCKKKIGAILSSEGKKVKCPGCGGVNTVPAAEHSDHSWLITEMFFDRIWNLAKALLHERSKPAEEEVKEDPNMKPCPCCGGKIVLNAWMCNHCGKPVGKIQAVGATRRFGER